MSISRDKRGVGPLSLYIHIPFCETKCPYCDFNTYAGIEQLIPSYVQALCRELAVWGDSCAGHRSARSSSAGVHRRTSPTTA